jgi:hypothetical protein
MRAASPSPATRLLSLRTSSAQAKAVERADLDEEQAGHAARSALEAKSTSSGVDTVGHRLAAQLFEVDRRTRCADAHALEHARPSDPR